ncbi:unnamed protein product [Blepharisma stoltei]|uniref:Sfi1 spindle body domain-containing protein n=1 Tax=Blepharisma stoltei TaxID=1481888 RepID=A0AAU9JMZ8_9CILI|nr:unnamed protein product [Blepharisma stoltei]
MESDSSLEDSYLKKGIDFYHHHLLSSVFSSFKIACGFSQNKKNLKNIANQFYQTALKTWGFKALRDNRNKLIGFYKLGWVLTKKVKESLAWGLEHMKPLQIILEESKEFSFMGDDAQNAKLNDNFDAFLDKEPDFGRDSDIKEEKPRKISNYMLSVLKSALKDPYRRILHWSFNGLKKVEKPKEIDSDLENLSTPRSIYRTIDKPLKSETPPMKYHAIDVTVKSEALSQRINSLMERIQSKDFSPENYASLETPTSVKSSKVNLYIPSTSSPGSPLSTMTMGALDTDRTSQILSKRSEKIQEELESMDNFEYAWKLFKAWKNYVMKKKIRKLKLDIAERNIFIRRCRLAFKAISEISKKQIRKKNKNKLALGCYAQTLLKTAIRKLKEGTRKTAERYCHRLKSQRNFMKKCLSSWNFVAKKMILNKEKIEKMNRKINKRIKVRFFHYLAIVTKLINMENQQNDLALIFWHDRILNWTFKWLREAVKISKKEIINEEIATTFSNAHLKRKYFFSLKENTEEIKKNRSRIQINLYYKLKNTGEARINNAFGAWVKFIDHLKTIDANLLKLQKNKHRCALDMADNFYNQKEMHKALQWLQINAASSKEQKRKKEERLKNIIKELTIPKCKRILYSWKNSKKSSAIAIFHNKSRLNRKIFNILKTNVENNHSRKYQKALKHLKGRIWDAWISYILKKKESLKEEKKLEKKADAFLEDLQLIRGMRRLKKFLAHRKIEKLGAEANKKLLIKKGLRRWKGYYERYLKLMRKARTFRLKKIEDEERLCLTRLNYNCKIKSWKIRAENRLFFYWDRKTSRMLNSWKMISMRNKAHRLIVSEHRHISLIKKSLQAWHLNKQINIYKAQKNQLADMHTDFILKTKGFAGIQIFTKNKKEKKVNIKKALEFYYYKTVSKALHSIKFVKNVVRTKKEKLYGIFDKYLRYYGLRKCTNVDPIFSAFFAWKIAPRQKPLPKHQIWQYSNTQQQKFKKTPSYLRSLFIKWLSMSTINSMSANSKALALSKKLLSKKFLGKWKSLVKYSKIRRKTLRVAMMFRRLKLKQKVFNGLRKGKKAKKVRWNSTLM